MAKFIHHKFVNDVTLNTPTSVVIQSSFDLEPTVIERIETRDSGNSFQVMRSDTTPAISLESFDTHPNVCFPKFILATVRIITLLRDGFRNLI